MYSIKTDLGVSGNGTIDKDLLVKGNAVVKGNLKVEGTVDFANATFTQITVTGDANLANIVSTGTSSLTNVNVSGNTVLGDASTDTVTVNATSTFASPVVLQGNVTQQSGTASFKATSADSLTVAGVSTLNGNLNMGAGTKATMKDLETDTLKVNGNSILGGTLAVTGTSTFGDVVINGTLSGTYTMDAGNFNSIKVAQLSDLNNVNIKGSTTLTGNLTGTNSTISINHVRMLGSDAIVDFAYNDPLRPTDIKSSIEPYQISSNNFVAKSVKSDSADIGVVGGTSGLHAIGRATIDYLNITGNSTIGDQTQLAVQGKSVFTGKTTVGDLEITGSVTGLTFSDLTVDSLTVTGASNLQGVTVGGNITGSSSSISKFATFTVADGTAGNHGIIQFDYSDSARPNDIKSSIEPYKVSTTDVAAKNVVSDAATIGVVGGTSGLHALGKATIDYLKIAGNSTIGTASPQLEVTGKSILGDVDFTGTVTGLTVDVSGQDLTPNSVVATAAVTGDTLSSVTTTSVGTNLTVGGTSVLTGKLTAPAADFSGDINVTGQTVTVKDLVVTGTTTGVTAEADVDGLDIAPNSVAVTTTLDVTGKSTLGEVETGATTLASATVTGATTLAGVTASALTTTTLDVTGATTLAGVTASTLTVPTVAGTKTTFTGDVEVQGTFTPAAIDLSTTDVAAKSITTTGDANVGGNLVVTGTVDLTAADVSVKSLTTPGVVTSTDATNPSTLPVLNSTSLTATNADITDLTVTGKSVVGAVTSSGKVTAVSVETATIANAAGITLANDATAAGDLTVQGTLVLAGGLDLSDVDITSKSITTTEGATIGGNLSVAGTVDLSGADVTALSFVSTDADKTNTFPKLQSSDSTLGAAKSTTLNVTGVSTLAGVTATTLDVTGASTFAGVTASDVATTTLDVSGSAAFDGGITSGNSQVEILKNTSVTGDLSVSGTLTAGVIDLSTTDVTVKSLNSLGNAHVVGDLTVDGQFDLSSTNLAALSLASSGNTTVGADLVLTTGNITGSPKVSGTLNVTGATTLAGVTTGAATLNSATVTSTLGVTGATTLAGLTAGATGVTTLASSGKATLNSLEVTNASVMKGDLTVEGTLLPQGGLDLSGADISANSLELAAGATVGTTLAVTTDATVGGTLTVTGASTLAAVTATSVTGSGAGKFDTVTSDNGLTVTAGGATVTAGDLTVTAGNIVQSGAASATASFKKTATTNLHVGSLVWDESKYIAEVGGAVHISGDLDVDGTINAAINLTGRDIAPRSIATSQDITVGTTLDVTGQATMASAIIGEDGSPNNNLQVNGNVVCTGNFTVQGLIIGTLDQSTSDITVKSVTATTFVKGATLESTGIATIGGKLTVSAGGAAVTGGTTSDTLTTTGIATIGGKLTVSAGGAAVTGGLASDTLTVTGLSTLAAVNATNVSASGTLAVTGTSAFTGKVTAADLESTGTITANNLTVTGTLTTDIADLVTESVTTNRYAVKAKAMESVGATWTPDGSSNVYNITLTAASLTIPSFPYTVGEAGSWFIYVTQDATGGRTINWNAPFGVVGDSEINGTENSVSICQVVYSGVGDRLDVFIAQRNL
jgi:hypothetical protein